MSLICTCIFIQKIQTRNETRTLKMQFPAPSVACSPFFWELACLLWCQMGHVYQAIANQFERQRDLTEDTLTRVHPFSEAGAVSPPALALPMVVRKGKWRVSLTPVISSCHRGGTRGQHRLTQPTAGTGQQPAWPWDQRSMEVAGSHLWAPPPRLSLQQLLINPTHPLLLGADQNAPFPAPCIACLCPRWGSTADYWVKDLQDPARGVTWMCAG